MTIKDDEWKPFSWYCVNCGTLMSGFKNKNGDTKGQCTKCGVVMVRTFKSKKKQNVDCFEAYAPKGMVRIG